MTYVCVQEKKMQGCSYMCSASKYHLQPTNQAGCHEGLKLQGKFVSKVIFQQTVFHKKRAVNVINNQWGFTLQEQKPYIKTVHGFILFGHSARHVKSAPVPAFIASRFVFIFPRFLKKKKRNYRCCHPLTGTPACSHGKCKRGPALLRSGWHCQWEVAKSQNRCLLFF